MIVSEVRLGPHVGAWFTGRDGTGGGNLAHRRPHRPAELAGARAFVGRETRTSPSSWHLMHQVHGSRVGVIDATTPAGAELRGVDALVTALPQRPLVVQVADCVPVLVAGRHVVAAIHAGRQGVLLGVVPAALAELRRLEGGDAPFDAALGPAIGGCCYEVPAALRDELAGRVPAAAATTTWGTPSLDLPAAVRAQLEADDVRLRDAVGGCTRCDPEQRWFSHRANPDSGRQIGLVVRRDAAASRAGVAL